MDDTLRLALVNHAILHGLGYDKAWPLVDQFAAEGPDLDVRQLADRVREAAVSSGAWGIPSSRL